jgi:hypothetical protein
MSRHVLFRRQAVQQEFAQNSKFMTMPAPNRGIIRHENEAFMQPGGCLICDNWMPTLRGVRLRGGTINHCDLHALDATVPPVPSDLRKPVVSMFEYVSGTINRLYAGQQTKLFDVTATTPVLVKSGQDSGNYVASQMSNASGDHMLVANDAGDFLLYTNNGTTWTTYDGGQITFTEGPVAAGENLVYVWKYRNRLFFIESNSMNAYYLGIDAIQGALTRIHLSGAASKGGKLLFGAVWSLDTGAGTDDKCVFVTNLGEVLIFTGNPADQNSWKQEGRYAVSPPLGMNAHIQVGGDLLIMTVDGIVPLSQAINKDAGQLELAMISRAIQSLWREEAARARAYPWTFEKWDELGALFVTWPGGKPGQRYCAAINNATGAWARFPGIDAMCFGRLGPDFFFGTQDGIVMQAERTGYDNGVPYVATLVGGWNTFGPQAAQIVWHQARATFAARPRELFVPALASTVDYVITIPPPPPRGPDPGVEDVWDQGLWDQALWDQASLARPGSRNTMWVSIGMTGYAHAPIVQVTVAQQARPDVELIALDAIYERAGVNV